MKVAFIHDWLFGMRGGEKVLEVLINQYPNCDIYCLFGNKKNVSEQIANKTWVSSFADSLPGIHIFYRYLLPIFPILTWSLGRKLAKMHQSNKYDLVISVSHAAAKNVITPESVPHLSYCLTPMRYIWGKEKDYFKNSFKRALLKPLFSFLRNWDKKKSKKIDKIIGISDFVSNRIKRCYGIVPGMVYPPVNTRYFGSFSGSGEALSIYGLDSGDYFLCANALVPYKNTTQIVSAFNELGYKLLIVGKGPCLREIQSIMGQNVTHVEFLKEQDLAEVYSGCRALVFGAEEDFGIIPVEVQACGRPVIALGRGGSLETVCEGVFFDEPTKESIKAAVEEFIEKEKKFEQEKCIEHAKGFSEEIFIAEFRKQVSELLNVENA